MGTYSTYINDYCTPFHICHQTKLNLLQSIIDVHFIEISESASTP